MNTKAEVLAKILADLPTNGNNELTAAILQGVLNFMADQETLVEDISYTNGNHPLIANIKQALDELIENNIPTWVDQDYPDNYTVFYDGALYHSNDVIAEGEAAPDASAKWDLVSGTGGDDMTAGEIVTALETLAINAALNSTKVRYSTGVSVYAQILAMVADIAAKQPKLYNSRYFVGGTGESSSWIIEDALIHPVMFCINGKYYNGREASNFNVPYASYDYRYVHNGDDTEFYLNPLISPAISFAAGDTVDIVHSSVAIGDPD